MKPTLALELAEESLRQAQTYLPVLFRHLSGASNALGLATFRPESEAIAQDVILVADLMARAERHLETVHQAMADVRTLRDREMPPDVPELRETIASLAERLSLALDGAAHDPDCQDHGDMDNCACGPDDGEDGWLCGQCASLSILAEARHLLQEAE